MSYTNDVYPRFTQKKWDELLLIDLVNHFFWVVLDELLGDWRQVIHLGGLDLEYWGKRLERDFEDYMR